jgi:hypothetical protein
VTRALLGNDPVHPALGWGGGGAESITFQTILNSIGMAIVDAPIQAGIASLLTGSDFETSLIGALRRNLSVDVIAPGLMYLAGNALADMNAAPGSPEAILLHAGAGAISGYITSGAKGAQGGALGAALAELALVIPDLQNLDNFHFNASLSSLIGGMGSLLVGDASLAGADAAYAGYVNNLAYHNATMIHKVTKAGRDALEEKIIKGELTEAQAQEAYRNLDASAQTLDAILEKYKVNAKFGLVNVLARMSEEDIGQLSEAIGNLALIPGMAISAYELVTGRTVATQEEASMFLAAIGVVPGERLVQGVGKVAKILLDSDSIAAAKGIVANMARGKEFEEAVLDFLKENKNTQAFSVMVNGKLTTVIPDGGVAAGKILEIKDAAYLSKSPQFRAYAELVENGGIIKTGGNAGEAIKFSEISLVVSPNTKISEPLKKLITDSGGSISEFDPISKTLKPWVGS